MTWQELDRELSEYGDHAAIVDTYLRPWRQGKEEEEIYDLRPAVEVWEYRTHVPAGTCPDDPAVHQVGEDDWVADRVHETDGLLQVVHVLAARR